MQTPNVTTAILNAAHVNLIKLAQDNKTYGVYRSLAPTTANDEYFMVGGNGRYVTLFPVEQKPNTFAVIDLTLQNSGSFKGQYMPVFLGYVKLVEGEIVNLVQA